MSRDTADFRECAECAAKPGTPVLCASCVHNRHTIFRLRSLAPVETWDVHIAREDKRFRATVILPRAMWNLPGVLGSASERGGWLFGVGDTNAAALADLERAIGAAVLDGGAALVFKEVPK